MDFLIDKDRAGISVLSFLRAELKISSTALTSLKADPIGITANGQHVTVRYILKEGDLLSVNEKDREEDANEAILPVDIPLNIIFENNDIIIADKPPYMPTHPSHGHFDDTLANAIAFRYAEKKEPFVFRPIGRLDRNTSGVSIIAKSSICASFLDHARKNDRIHKKYIAVLCGRIESSQEINVIDAYIKRQAESIITRCVCEKDDAGAIRAITNWRLIYATDEISIVEAQPITGRTHQLRVHFAHLGHPILGDDVYGSPTQFIGRHALHAHSITVQMPYGTENAEFVSPIPEDMERAVLEISGVSIKKIYEKIGTHNAKET